MLTTTEIAIELVRIEMDITYNLGAKNPTRQDLQAALAGAYKRISELRLLLAKPRKRRTKAEVEAETRRAEREEAEKNGQITIEEAVQEDSE